MTLRECRDSARMLSPYLDGELEAAKIVDIDNHVAACETCREEVQLLRAMRASLRRVVRAPAPGGLRDRIANAIVRAEQARDDARAAAAAGGGREFGAGAPVVDLASWKTMVPLATAAAIALMWGAATRGAQPASNVDAAHAGFGDDLLSELVAQHSQQLPPEATDPKTVQGFDRYVGVPVRPERAGMRFVGARLVPMRTQSAAMLQYEVGGSRMSVLVYDAQKIHVGTVGMASLTPRPVGTAEVRVGRQKGYSVVAAQHAGVGCLVASDLDPDRSAQAAVTVCADR